MNKMIEIATSTEILKYHVEKETRDNVLIKERSPKNKKLRFSKKDNRLEHMINGKWDVCISKDSISQVKLYDADEVPTFTQVTGTLQEAIPAETPALVHETKEVLVDVFAGAPVLMDTVIETTTEEVPVEPIQTIEVSRVSGNAVIRAFAKLFSIPVKKTKKGEMWISLNEEQYKDVLDYLLHDDDVKHMRWETKRGSKKSRIWDEVHGTEFIFKSGDGAYLWCTKN